MAPSKTMQGIYVEPGAFFGGDKQVFRVGVFNMNEISAQI